jgi:hypothetical protein
MRDRLLVALGSTMDRQLRRITEPAHRLPRRGDADPQVKHGRDQRHHPGEGPLPVRGVIGGAAREAADIGGGSLARSALQSAGNRELGSAVEAEASSAARSAGRDAVETAGSSVRSSERASVERPGSCTVPATNSFAAGAAVLMADGSTKPIEDVKVGDKVIATDPTTGKTAAQAVTATITGVGHKDMVTLTVDVDGEKGSKTATIDATEGHPFWAPDLNRWVSAADLKPGSLLQTRAGTYVQVTATRAWAADQKEVYNLTVDALHTYYVIAGNTPVLVHNNNGGYSSFPACDVPTLKGLARDIRTSGDHPASVNSKVVAVGQDEDGFLMAGGSTHLTPGSWRRRSSLASRCSSE